MEEQWQRVRFSREEIAAFSRRARDDLHRSAESGSRLLADQRRRLAELERRQQKLLDTYMADALPLEVLKGRQDSVATEIADARRLMDHAKTANDTVMTRLDDVIALLEHAEKLYATVGDQARALLNSAVFEAFRLDVRAEDAGPGPGQAGSTHVLATGALTPPVGAVVDEPQAQGSGPERTPAGFTPGEGSNVSQMAAHLTQSWNESVWGQVAKIVEKGVPATPRASTRRPAQPLQKQVRLQAAQVDALVADYQCGASMEALSRKYGVSPETVRRWLVVRGVRLRPMPIGMPKDKIAEAVELRAQGWSWHRLAERYGCSHTAARRAVLSESGG